MRGTKRNSEKLTLFSGILMSLGSIIGAGVFSSTPVAIKIVGGPAIVIGYILGALFLFFKELPTVCMSSVLPANGAGYMRLTRLSHPILGMMHVFIVMSTGVLKVATLSLTFSTYFCILFPQVPDMVAAAGCVIVFTILTLYGLRVSSIVQNVSVVTLVIALLLYVILGMPQNTMTLKEVLFPIVKFSRLWAGISILQGSLYGANVLMGIAEDLENPRRNVPIGYLASTLACALLYCFVGWVTIGGKIPWFKVQNLADVARTFMPTGLLVFFITGGALLAVITSMNAILLSFSRDTFVAARDLFFPGRLAKLNKYRVPANAIIINSVVALIFIFGQFDLADVQMITNIPTTLLSPLYIFPMFVIAKRFPYSFKENFFRTPYWALITFAIAGKVIGFSMGLSVLKIMGKKNWMSALIYFAAFGTYALIRYIYLKSKGINLMATMRRPYEPWTKHERALAEADAAKKAKAAK